VLTNSFYFLMVHRLMKQFGIVEIRIYRMFYSPTGHINLSTIRVTPQIGWAGFITIFL
jgi:hypothetical protein